LPACRQAGGEAKRKNTMTEVKFYDTSYTPEINLTYSVIAAKYGNKWLYVRHHNRKTWEIPGGHIEKDETADEAARRELMEETGALDFTIECVSTYSVFKNGETGYGRLYLAEISNLGLVPDTSEIAEVKMMDKLPENLTHPDIQPYLYKRILEYLESKN
jgi:8-oxo-dGTP diphosphatase